MSRFRIKRWPCPGLAWLRPSTYRLGVTSHQGLTFRPHIRDISKMLSSKKHRKNQAMLSLKDAETLVHVSHLGPEKKLSLVPVVS